MKKNLFIWQFGCFVVTALCGTLLHFLYDWTNKNTAAAIIAAVNESTWEHMKLLYFPMLVFALIRYRYFRYSEGYWWIKLTGILTGLISIPVLFYTYNGAIGKSPDWLNIGFFFTSAAIGSFTEYMLFRNNKTHHRGMIIPITIMLSIGVLFVYFTFVPPLLPIFRDPLTGTFGIRP